MDILEEFSKPPKGAHLQIKMTWKAGRIQTVYFPLEGSEAEWPEQITAIKAMIKETTGAEPDARINK